MPLLRPILGKIHGMAHITGGGFYENIPRVLPEGVDVVVRAGSWDTPPIFELLRREGGVSFEEMHRVFNMGIGMVVFAAADDLPRISRTWKEMNQRWFAVGNVRRGGSGVVIETVPR